MGQVYSGAVPGARSAGANIADLLSSGILAYNKEKGRQHVEDLEKQKATDELIRTGISSKTMRPAKTGETGDMKDSSGRSWMYDDSNLNEENKQRDELRKSTQWNTMYNQVSMDAEKQIQNGWITPQQRTAWIQKEVLSRMGAPDGKMDAKRYGDLGGEAQSFIDQFRTADAKAKSNINPTGITTQIPKDPGLFGILAHVFDSKQSVGAPTSAIPQQASNGGGLSAMYAGAQPDGGQQMRDQQLAQMGQNMWNGVKAGWNALGPTVPNHTVDPNAPKPPDMSALMNLLQMKNQDQAQGQ